ncbi:DUF4179 domain-containing protein [Paenibacillus pasadenensis]|uniref:DUF4179 domain-containing protein n=1 Tax=Paenibacillus pasadenensis TaxID=217090 RepID=UPI0003FFC8B9|nr:DUF4179 domain-containing protein [Paenibacillus pasadenensis]
MKPGNIDERLEALRIERDREADLPAKVELRLEEAYQMIRAGKAAGRREDGPLPGPDEVRDSRLVRPRMQRLRRSAAAAAAGLLLLGAGTAGLGFISPAFADSLRSVPVLGSLLSMYGDKGMQAAEEQGLVQPVEMAQTIGDTTISIRNVVYDGSRIVLEVHRDGEGEFYSRDLRSPEKGDLTWVEARLEGQELMPSWRPAGDDSVLVSMDRVQTELPERSELELLLTVAGVEQPVRFDIPLAAGAESIVIDKPAMPEELAKRGFVVDKVIVTPVTTKLLFHLRPKAQDSAGTFVHPDDFDMSAAQDEHGRTYAGIGGQGDPETDEGSKQVQLFEPLDPEAKVLKLIYNVAGIGAGDKPYSIVMEVPLPDRQR